MSNNAADKSKLFINKVDEHTRAHIMRLDQKLRLMRAEIEAKLASIDLYGDADDEHNKQGLQEVEREIGVALAGISELVNMIVAPEQEEFILQEDKMTAFKEMLSKNFEKLSKMSKLES